MHCPQRLKFADFAWRDQTEGENLKVWLTVKESLGIQLGEQWRRTAAIRSRTNGHWWRQIGRKRKIQEKKGARETGPTVGHLVTRATKRIRISWSLSGMTEGEWSEFGNWQRNNTCVGTSLIDERHRQQHVPYCRWCRLWRENVTHVIGGYKIRTQRKRRHYRVCFNLHWVLSKISGYSISRKWYNRIPFRVI